MPLPPPQQIPGFQHILSYLQMLPRGGTAPFGGTGPTIGPLTPPGYQFQPYVPPTPAPIVPRPLPPAPTPPPQPVTHRVVMPGVTPGGQGRMGDRRQPQVPNRPFSALGPFLGAMFSGGILGGGGGKTTGPRGPSPQGGLHPGGHGEY